MSNPKRHGFKNLAHLKKDYRSNYWFNFFLGAAVSWPLAIMIGRRMTQYQGGVAVVPLQRFVHDHPNVHAMRTTQRYFRRWSFGTMFICGTIFARYYTDDSMLNNTWYTRPDLKPKMAMVDIKDQTDYDPVAYEQLLDHAYKKYKSEPRKSALYRLIWPDSADFTPKTNLYVGRDPSTNYNTVTGEFPKLNHTYQDHQH